MNVQPKPSPDCHPMTPPMRGPEAQPARQPGGPRAFATWPVELEVDPWRP